MIVAIGIGLAVAIAAHWAAWPVFRRGQWKQLAPIKKVGVVLAAFVLGILASYVPWPFRHALEDGQTAQLVGVPIPMGVILRAGVVGGPMALFGPLAVALNIATCVSLIMLLRSRWRGPGAGRESR